MALQTTMNINVDFYDKKYILINAKQLDKKSRFLSVTCYDHGEPVSINNGEHSAYVRYKKADNNSVFNFCDIDRKGKITVELTEQMLAVDGICCVDLVIVNKGGANVDPQTGEITGIENASILSTMPFHIDVTETAVENSDIESSYEFDALNRLLVDATADYEEVVTNARSWAIGGTGNGRENEDTDNAKYYAKQSSNSANNADTSESNALSSYNLAKSYAVGNTGVRENEDTDNSKYYYNMIKNIINGIETGFIPMGTITFAELANAERATGYVYNISDDFVTDESFREGSGKSYTAGTNVYFCADGLWDCFGGATFPTANINEVKLYLGIYY